MSEQLPPTTPAEPPWANHPSHTPQAVPPKTKWETGPIEPLPPVNWAIVKRVLIVATALIGLIGAVAVFRSAQTHVTADACAGRPDERQCRMTPEQWLAYVQNLDSSPTPTTTVALPTVVRYECGPATDVQLAIGQSGTMYAVLSNGTKTPLSALGGC